MPDPDVLKQIYNACDPYKPATAEYYLDCGEARGSSALIRVFQRHLQLAQDYCCFLFSGHIGCGKSSELEHVRQAISHHSPPSPCLRYFPILLNVSDYLDDYDVAVSDILLAIVTELAATLRDELGVELKDTYFHKRINELSQYLLSDVEINEGEISLPNSKVKVQRLKKDPDARQKVRSRLMPQLSTMLEEINTVFLEARLAVKNVQVPEGEQPYSDIVLMLDNLERIRKLTDIPEGLASQRELFLDRYTQLAEMKAHILYTVPLRLVRSADGPQLEQQYGPLFVLPMVKVIERNRVRYTKGVAFLRELLTKRLGSRPLEEVFEADALEFLLTYSGGHMRNLMTFVQNACTYTDHLPIPLTAAHRAIQQTVRTYSTAIPESHWTKLAELDLSSSQQISNGDPDYLTMLENLSVLEYINGGEEDNPFTPAEPWYAVNPVVRELQKFKAARAALSSQPNSPS